MEKNEKYILTKKLYNSKLSSFQISKDLHHRVKEYCIQNNIKVKDFLEQSILKSLDK
jgi:hypothetical protein